MPLRKTGFTLIELPAVRKGFTLIELLVVITIIVVLLALLTPALDKAIYQAELAVCGANLKGVGVSVSGYAFENKRLYPYRPSVALGKSITSTLVWNGSRDDRPYVRSRLSINKSLIDPFCDPVDLEHSVGSQNYVSSSYGLYWGWQWTGASGKGAAMRKLGDRFTHPDDGRGFRLLAGDWDNVKVGGVYQGSHPDSAGAASNVLYQGQTIQSDPAGSAGEIVANGGVIYSLSWWVAVDASTRGVLDRNFLYDDLAVLRLGGLAIDPATDEPDDERLVSVPSRNDGSDPLWLETLPRH